MPQTQIPPPSWNRDNWARNASQAKYPSILKGLTGAWSPNFGNTGGVLYDASRHGITATLTGMDPPTDWVHSDGKLALDLDGSNDYLNAGQHPLLNPTALTYSCWVKFTNLTPAYTSVINKINGISSYHSLFVKSTGKIAIYVYTTAPVFYDGTGGHTVTTGVWTHLGFSYSSTAGLTGYMNGEPEGPIAANGPLASVPTDTAFGTDLVNAGRYLTGQMDDILYWNFVQPPDVLRQIYQLGRGGWAEKRARRAFKVPAAPGGAIKYVVGGGVAAIGGVV